MSHRRPRRAKKCEEESDSSSSSDYEFENSDIEKKYTHMEEEHGKKFKYDQPPGWQKPPPSSSMGSTSMGAMFSHPTPAWEEYAPLGGLSASNLPATTFARPPYSPDFSSMGSYTPAMGSYNPRPPFPMDTPAMGSYTPRPPFPIDTPAMGSYTPRPPFSMDTPAMGSYTSPVGSYTPAMGGYNPSCSFPPYSDVSTSSYSFPAMSSSSSTSHYSPVMSASCPIPGQDASEIDMRSVLRNVGDKGGVEFVEIPPVKVERLSNVVHVRLP